MKFIEFTVRLKRFSGYGESHVLETLVLVNVDNILLIEENIVMVKGLEPIECKESYEELKAKIEG